MYRAGGSTGHVVFPGVMINTSTIPGAAGASGAITVASDARYGALSGKAVALEPATGFSFDTPMMPRPH